MATSLSNFKGLPSSSDWVKIGKKIAISVLPFYRRSVGREEELKKYIDGLAAAVFLIPQWCIKEAGKYGVTATVHPNDFIFQFTLRYFHDRGIAEGVKYYFDTGNMSANKLRTILFNDIGLKARPIRLLEFASGYGCVSRHLVKFSEDIELTASDIHDEARNFYATCLSIPFIKSASLPEDFDPLTTFDVVFALSFFSHMPELSWGRWLKKLFECVAPGGYLIFTAHGVVSNHGLKGFSKNGFKFYAGSEQNDLPGYEYGITHTTPTFVRNEIAKLSNAKLFLLREGDWWGHQDLYVVQKHPASA